MDGWVLLIVVGSVLSSIIGLLFWGGIAVLGAKAIKQAGRGGGGFPGVGAGAFDPQLLQFAQQLQALVAQAQALQGGGPPSALNLGALQHQFNSQAFAAQQRLRDLDQLSRQRHETMMADMLGQASSAGIDVSSWRF